MMKMNNALFLIAGSFILVSTILATAHSPLWLIVTGLVGINLVQAAFTGWCPMMAVLRRAGIKE